MEFSFSIDDGNGERRRTTKTQLYGELGFVDGVEPGSSEYEFAINGIICSVVFTGNNFAAYVDIGETLKRKRNITPSLRKVLRRGESDGLENITGIYVPHGGFTHAHGFDCAHRTDITLAKVTKPRASFKSMKFVVNELRRLTESILKISHRESLQGTGDQGRLREDIRVRRSR